MLHSAAAVPAVSARAEQPLAVEHARTLAEVVDVVTRTYVEFRTARKREELVERPRDAAQLLELAVGGLLTTRGVEVKLTLVPPGSEALLLEDDPWSGVEFVPEDAD